MAPGKALADGKTCFYGGNARKNADRAQYSTLLFIAVRTGTLWENDSSCASCSHGFASYAAHFIRVIEENKKNHKKKDDFFKKLLLF